MIERKGRKIFGQQRRSKADREREENIWSIEEKRKREGRGGKYLEKEHIWSVEEMKYGEGKGKGGKI